MVERGLRVGNSVYTYDDDLVEDLNIVDSLLSFDKLYEKFLLRSYGGLTCCQIAKIKRDSSSITDYKASCLQTLASECLLCLLHAERIRCKIHILAKGLKYDDVYVD